MPLWPLALRVLYLAVVVLWYGRCANCMAVERIMKPVNSWQKRFYRCLH